ncbi:MAG: MurR/RpiR family transcriptional regulator [Bacteroidota bacterium]
MTEKRNSPIFLINALFDSLSKSEKRVAEFVQKHMDETVLLTLNGLAKKCNTSDATVLRFCRSLGYLGFADFKVTLVPELLRSGKSIYVDANNKDESQDVQETFRQNFINQTDSTFKNCAGGMLSLVASQIIAANRVVILGLGGSAGVAQIFCDSLGSLGVFSNFFGDRSLIQNIIPILKPNDVVVGISHSGETEEIVAAIKKANEYGAKTVGITNSSQSKIASVAQIQLITGVSANLMGSYSCQARISQLVILELVLSEISKLFTKKNS